LRVLAVDYNHPFTYFRWYSAERAGDRLFAEGGDFMAPLDRAEFSRKTTPESERRFRSTSVHLKFMERLRASGVDLPRCLFETTIEIN